MEKLSIEELESLESTCAPFPQCLKDALSPPPYYCVLMC